MIDDLGHLTQYHPLYRRTFVAYIPTAEEQADHPRSGMYIGYLEVIVSIFVVSFSLHYFLTETKKGGQPNDLEDKRNPHTKKSQKRNTAPTAQSVSPQFKEIKDSSLNYDKWKNIDESIDLIEKNEDETCTNEASETKRLSHSCGEQVELISQGKKSTASTTTLSPKSNSEKDMAHKSHFEDEANIFENSGFDPNKAVFDGNEGLAKKVLALDEKQFCSFLNKQLSLLPVQRGSDFVGESFAPPITAVKKKKVKLLPTTSYSNSAREEKEKKATRSVKEVKDLVPLLYTCLSLHIGKVEAQKVLNYFSGLEAQYLNSLSLDDIEEIAARDAETSF